MPTGLDDDGHHDLGNRVLRRVTVSPAVLAFGEGVKSRMSMNITVTARLAFPGEDVIALLQKAAARAGST